MTNTSKVLLGTFPSIFVMSNGCFSQPVRQSPDVLVAIKTWRLSQGVRQSRDVFVATRSSFYSWELGHLQPCLWRLTPGVFHGKVRPSPAKFVETKTGCFWQEINQSPDFFCGRRKLAVFHGKSKPPAANFAATKNRQLKPNHDASCS